MTNEQLRQCADEFGELSRQKAAFAPVETRLKKLKEIFAEEYADQPGEMCEIEGRIYRVQITPCALERKITNMRRLYRLLGVSKFLEWCTFPLSAVDRLTADQSSFVETTQTGPRKVTAVLLAAAKPKAA